MLCVMLVCVSCLNVCVCFLFDLLGETVCVRCVASAYMSVMA